MTITTADLMTFGGHNLPFAQDLREAIANYARRKWPTNTSGHMAKAWGLTKDKAKNVLKLHASDATITAILREGGWELVLPVMGAVIGEPVDAFFRDQMKRAAREAERAYEHEQLASAAYRTLAGRPAASGEDRRSWPRAGAVGPDQARRVAGRD